MEPTDFLGLCLIVVAFTLLGLGATHLVIDYRTFNEITAECRKNGYVQNNSTRVFCVVEAKPNKEPVHAQ